MVDKYKEVDEFGNVYKGDVQNGKFHGKGTLLYAESGDVYHGDFENGVPHGSGKYLRDGGKAGVKDGVYEGLWNNGVLQQVKKGRAKIALENGDVYEGGFHHWKRHGMGKLIQNDGEVYNGQWKEGMKHGPGRIEYPDGAFFDGNFRNGEAVVANEGRDHDVSTSNELDLNPYRSTEKKKRQVPEYTEEDLKPKEGVPRTISFHSASVERERGNESVSRYGGSTVEQPKEVTKQSIKDKWRDRSVSRGKKASDVEQKRLQLEKLKDGKCLRKFAEKTIVKMEKKQPKEDSSEKKKGFSLFRGKKKQKEEDGKDGYEHATQQYVNDYVDNIPEFFDFEHSDGPRSYQMVESKPPPKRLPTPREGRKEIPSTRAKSPLPRSSSRHSGRREVPNQKNRLPSRPHVGSKSRGRSASGVQRESSNSRGRSLSTPRQPQSSSRGRSSSRARERPPSSRKEASERIPPTAHERSSSRARGRSSSRQRDARDNMKPSRRERSKSNGHERSTSRQRSGQEPTRSTSKQRSGRERARSSSRAHDRSSSRPRASQERSSSRARDMRNPVETIGENRIPRQRSIGRNKVPIDSKARKEALMKKYNQGNLHKRDSVQSKTSQRSDLHTLKSINMKGKSGTAQMLYVNDESDDDSKYFLR